NILGEVGCAVESVEITDLKENTYYAAVYLNLGGRQVMIDSRPSDAIALALRTKSPIFVAKAVLEASSVLQQNEEGKDEAAVENVSNVSTASKRVTRKDIRQPDWFQRSTDQSLHFFQHNQSKFIVVAAALLLVL